jgi:hypothetical protein
MKKRGRPRGSENNPIDFGESQESCASLMNHLDALQVEEDEIQPEQYSPPAATTVRRLRSGSLISPPVVAVGARSVSSSREVAMVVRSNSSSRAVRVAAESAIAVLLPKLAVSGFVMEHGKSGQYVAPQNGVFVYDITDSRSVRTVTKKMADIKEEFKGKTLHEFTAKGSVGMLPTSVAGASHGFTSVTMAKCFQNSKRAKTSSD